MLIVQKFGGSSLSTVSKIKKIAFYLSKLAKKGNKIVVVASAMGKTTNKLLEVASKAGDLNQKRDVDFLLATGEMKSVALLSLATNGFGVKSTCLTGFQAGIETNSIFGKAYIEKINVEKLKAKLKDLDIVFVAGFQGIDKNGEITTLGRGGSDTTAVALAGALKAPCEIYTDVEAVYRIDPRIFKDAKKFKVISHQTMIEMAFNGAKVLDLRCVEVAKKFGVKLYLGKTLEERKKGTYVVENKKEFFEKVKVEGLAFKDGYKQVKIYSTKKIDLSKILNGFVQSLVAVEMLCVEEIGKMHYVSYCVPASCEEIMKKELENFDVDFAIEDEKTKVSLIGCGFASHAGLSKDISILLEKNKIDVQKFVATETNLSFLIEKDKKELIAKLLAKKYNL